MEALLLLQAAVAGNQVCIGTDAARLLPSHSGLLALAHKPCCQKDCKVCPGLLPACVQHHIRLQCCIGSVRICAASPNRKAMLRLQ